MSDNNYKYANYAEIENRVMARLKGFNKAVSSAEVLEWCMQIENEICVNVDNMYIYTQVPLKVYNDKARVPCNTYRIVDVYTEHGSHGNGGRVKFNDLGSYLIFNPRDKVTNPLIDYYGSPIDMETGEPLIQRGHELACEWFCVYNALFSDFGTGKINANFWQEVKLNKENEILAAQCYSLQFKTRDELNQEMKITFDEFPQPAKLWLLSDEVKHHVRHVLP